MLKPQKKVSRKEIKEDWLVTNYYKVTEWMEGHRRAVSYVIGIPVVLIVVVILWRQKQAEWNETATTELARIMPYYEDGKYDLAINGVVQEGIHGLQSIVDEYGSTHAGETAKLYLANAYFNIGNYDKALESFKEVNLSDKLLSASALSGAGACYEAKGDRIRAAEYFERASTRNMAGPQAPENLQNAARNYAAAGRKDKAVELLKTLKHEFPNSPFARDVDRYIAEYRS